MRIEVGSISYELPTVDGEVEITVNDELGDDEQGDVRGPTELALELLLGLADKLYPNKWKDSDLPDLDDVLRNWFSELEER